MRGKVVGFAGRDFLHQQLVDGTVDMPTVSYTLKESGAVNFAIEDFGEDDIDEASAMKTSGAVTFAIEDIEEEEVDETSGAVNFAIEDIEEDEVDETSGAVNFAIEDIKKDEVDETSAMKESGAVNFDIEEYDIEQTQESYGDEMATPKWKGIEQGFLTKIRQDPHL